MHGNTNNYIRNIVIILSLVMWLEQTLEVSITDIGDIKWFKQAEVIHLTCSSTFPEFSVTTFLKS
jgi:hypothetical protein